MPPGLALSLNGTELVTISSGGLNILSVSVFGDRVAPDFASLDVSGGLYGEEKDHKHLIWEPDRIISPGDEIAVTLLGNATTSCPGRTIAELYPEGQPHGPWQPVEQVFQELAKRPIVRERFTFAITPPSGQSIHAETLPSDHSFGFSVTWVWLDPERARVSLWSNTLEGIAKRQGGGYACTVSVAIRPASPAPCRRLTTQCAGPTRIKRHTAVNSDIGQHKPWSVGSCTFSTVLSRFVLRARIPPQKQGHAFPPSSDRQS